LERAGRKHNLRRRDAPVLELDYELIAVTGELRCRSAKAYRQVEVRCIPLDVPEYLVARRVSVRIARELQPRQAVVRARREQRERLPAVTPSRRDILLALEDQKVAVPLSEVVADSETGLTAADYDDVVMGAAAKHGGHRCGPGARGRESVEASWFLLLVVTAEGGP
jgi:hypothetical protein